MKLFKHLEIGQIFIVKGSAVSNILEIWKKRDEVSAIEMELNDDPLIHYKENDKGIYWVKIDPHEKVYPIYE